MGKHNPQRDDGPEKGLYRLHPIALLAKLLTLDLPDPPDIMEPFFAFVLASWDFAH